MIIIVQLFFLIGIFTYSFIIHKNINKNNFDNFKTTPSSIISYKDDFEDEVEDEDEKNINTKISVVKKISDIKKKQKIKSIPTKINNQDSKNLQDVKDIKIDKDIEDNRIELQDIFSMSEERLNDIEKNEDFKELEKNKIRFEKQLDNIEEEDSVEQINVNYSNLLSQERKKVIGENILKNTNLKWYEQLTNGSAIEKIIINEDFKVKEYKF